MRTLLRLPRNAEGHLCVERYLHDRRPHPPSYVSWIDIRDDHPVHGRYLISGENTETVVLPASSDVIAGELDRRADLGE
ncbi:hypothetical protein [Nocardia abscessus]|uniref:hypothetical protein n=1 Tax=Nocardia abscessus TaxID=120957 RepID=UPI00245735A3|nr:hypothetical protein [Nocardia abscessus]